MLKERVGFLLEYVKNVESGLVKSNNFILREIASLTCRLSSPKGPEFDKAYNLVFYLLILEHQRLFTCFLYDHNH